LYQNSSNIKNFNVGEELTVTLAHYTSDALTELQKGNAETSARCPNLTIN